MKTKRILAVVIAIIMIAGLFTACGGAKSADEAYDAWVKGSAAAKVAEKEAEQANVDQTDKEAAKTFMKDYIEALKASIAELEKVDMDKLKEENKGKATTALANMKTNLTALEAALANADAGGGQENPETPENTEAPENPENPENPETPEE